MVLAAGSAVTVTVVVYLEDDEASPNAMSEFERQEITARLARAFSLRDHSPVGRIKVSIIAPTGCGSEKNWSVTWAEDQLSGRLRKSPSSLPTAIFGLCLSAVRIVSTSSRRAKWELRPLAASTSAMLVLAVSADSIAVIRAAVDAPVVGMLNDGRLNSYRPKSVCIAPNGWWVLGTAKPRGERHVGVPRMFSIRPRRRRCASSSFVRLW